MADVTPDAHPLVAKVESILAPTDAEREALLALPMQASTFAAGEDIGREGDHPLRCCLMLEGLACTYKVTGQGRRQILAFFLPGDVPDLQGLHLDTLDTSLGAVRPCRVGLVPHAALRDLFHRHPRLGIALWRGTLIDAAVSREWIVNVGRREARGRVAHLLCEMVVRLRAVGLAEGHSCDLPLTQVELGDAVGLSVVHVNRMLQELRAAGLLSWNGFRLTVLDWERLKGVADFDPAYLHLERRQAAS